MSEPVWYRSLYWRIAFGFIALLAVVLVAQVVVFLWLTDRIVGPLLEVAAAAGRQRSRRKWARTLTKRARRCSSTPICAASSATSTSRSSSCSTTAVSARTACDRLPPGFIRAMMPRAPAAAGSVIPAAAAIPDAPDFEPGPIKAAAPPASARPRPSRRLPAAREGRRRSRPAIGRRTGPEAAATGHPTLKAGADLAARKPRRSPSTARRLARCSFRRKPRRCSSRSGRSGRRSPGSRSGCSAWAPQ